MVQVQELVFVEKKEIVILTDLFLQEQKTKLSTNKTEQLAVKTMSRL